jgi:hypothetical protein
MSSSKPLAGLYRLCLEAEKPGLLGSPSFHLSLLVYPSGSSVTGIVHIAQSVTPPGGNITVNVTGSIHEMAFGAQVTKVIALSGEYAVSFPPPAIGMYLAPFKATIVFHNEDKQGLSTFEWGHQIDTNVPTTNVAC